jgi:hypothetical protein
MTPFRYLLIAAAAAAAVVLFVVLRPADEEEAAPPATITTAVTTTAPTTTEAAPPEPATIRVTVRGGSPQGGIARVTVERGDRVRIVVRSDTADHVHVHGYDLMRDVAPGAPAQFAFVADLAGAFEIELEDSGIQIAELRVAP